jgi:hypothetical protein
MDACRRLIKPQRFQLPGQLLRDMPAVTTIFSEDEVAELDRITRQFPGTAKES